ncbi:unnamed protein product [Caenorhabditis bovis]|uniref:Uncharacterized protein n=1 Tax=Caenorhabditis bovis TaxID=2654633 RepID=A0A8S1F290_9PELO|nr:unnamed protein product [Caenorhabditis bovis]
MDMEKRESEEAIPMEDDEAQREANGKAEELCEEQKQQSDREEEDELVDYLKLLGIRRLNEDVEKLSKQYIEADKEKRQWEKKAHKLEGEILMLKNEMHEMKKRRARMVKNNGNEDDAGGRRMEGMV